MIKHGLGFLKERIRFNLQEISGGFGDLGTFIPLAVSMVLVCGLDAGSLLFWAGLFNIVSGLLFGLPVPVQPMKAIAAIAIADGLTAGQIAASGIGTALILIIICFTGVLGKCIQLIPKEIIRGIQLGVGLKLILMGIDYFLTDISIQAADWLPVLFCTGLIIAGLKFKKLPVALILFCLGLGIVSYFSPGLWQSGAWGWEGPKLTLPGWGEVVSGFTLGSIPQIPLTLLNSVIAVCALSGDLFPGKRISETRMALSVALMNITGCLFGAIPMCHGSGGLAAQYRFGGRTGGSVVFIGLLKMGAGVFLGGTAITVLAAFPKTILGLLLALAGVELCRPILKNNSSRQYVLTIFTATIIIFFNTAIGFLAGISLVIWLNSGFVKSFHRAIFSHALNRKK